MGQETVSELLKRTTDAVRKLPADASLRMKLFRLFCVTGQWERASTQLSAASNLDASLAMTTVVWGHAVACERLRAEVFAGKRQPLFLGEPQPWLGWLIQALAMAPDEAANLRDEAFEAAPESSGSVNGQPFDWLADADSRLGPVCEVFVDGKYFWVPFSSIEAIELGEPADMLDLVWASAQMTLAGGGIKPVLIPVRYPGTEACEEDALRLARGTRWQGDDTLGYTGLGQREWASAEATHPLLDARTVLFDASTGRA